MKPIIEVRGLSKRYKLGVFNAKTLREEAEAFLARFGRRKAELAGGSSQSSGGSGLVTSNSLPATAEPSSDFWALRDVSFDVQPGEVIGVIGRNGAGKSTLLKILSRITEPTSGEARIRGRVASLLEVGTGFHPELSGRENVFLNGAILGMTKQEIRNKFDEIVAFAEIEKFIDTPVKRYSSGMYVRLAFAVAAHLEPEILIVDEVLAVGDMQFQHKCLGKMKDVSGKDGRTVLFVSHNMDAVRSLCGRCLLLEKSAVAVDGSPGEAIDRYLANDDPANDSYEFSVQCMPSVPVAIERVRISAESLQQKSISFETPIPIEITYKVNTEVSGSIVNFEVTRNEKTVLLSFDTDETPELFEKRPPGTYVTRASIPAKLLKPGSYLVSFNTGRANGDTWQRLENCLRFDIHISSGNASLLSYSSNRPGVIACPIVWTPKTTGH